MKHIKLFENFTTKKPFIETDYKFSYSCINPDSEDELDAIIEHMYDNEVSIQTFLTIIDFDDINMNLGVNYNSEKDLLKDYHVKCYVGSFWYDYGEDFNRELAEDDGEEYDITVDSEFIDYAVLVNSSVEYVWKK